MLNPEKPALILAPMEGVTDAPMRAFQGEAGAFTYAVSEFLRISQDIPSKRAFYRHVPELCHGGCTPSGLPVQVQLLGGDAEKMAVSAAIACEAGAKAIDINFGCPAPTVNRHDGGASLLKYPTRIREIVAAVRAAVPSEIPVSAKLRLGWDSVDSIFENAAMAAEGGASWLTVHARTRVQGYAPPVNWRRIGEVRERLQIPVVANGDIWTLDGFRACRDETGCRHFMIGRGALANPVLSHQIAHELGLTDNAPDETSNAAFDWTPPMRRFVELMHYYEIDAQNHTVCRLKQWLKLAANFGGFRQFDAVKYAKTVDEFFTNLCSIPPE